MTSEIQAKIAALVESAARDAYQEGYVAGRRDALSGIVQAAQAQLGDAGPVTTISPAQRPSSPANSAPPRAPGAAMTPDAKAPRARRGTVRELVREFVMANPGSKEAHFAALHPTVKRSSYYMAYQSLEKEGVIRRDGLYCFPASMQWFPETDRLPAMPVGANTSDRSPIANERAEQSVA